MDGPAGPLVGGPGAMRRTISWRRVRLVVDWLIDEPERDFRAMPGTSCFTDITGFTTLAERLATRGKAGAQEMAELLNGAFDELLGAASDFRRV